MPTSSAGRQLENPAQCWRACLHEGPHKASVQHHQTLFSSVQVTNARAWTSIAVDVGLPEGALEVSKICRRRFKAAMLGSFAEVCLLAPNHVSALSQGCWDSLQYVAVSKPFILQLLLAPPESQGLHASCASRRPDV